MNFENELEKGLKKIAEIDKDCYAVVREIEELERRCEELLEPREIIFGNKRVLLQGLVGNDYHYADLVGKVYLKMGDPDEISEDDEEFNLEESDAVLVFQSPKDIDALIGRLEGLKKFWQRDESETAENRQDKL